MPQPDLSLLPLQLRKLEQERDSRAIVLAASHLDMELLPALYELCQGIGPVPRLDVVLHGRGGIVNAARRIALLLRQHARHLSFIVPFHCESAATLLALSADEIIAGDLALFSPIDPQLDGADGGSLSSLDIKRFGDMAQQWFGVDASEARQQSLSLLCGSIFPPSLTAFYRSTLELAQIGEELLAWQLPQATPEARRAIVGQLAGGYHSHNYALTREELASLGLNMTRDAHAERVGWAISTQLQASIGGALRSAPDEPWNDALLASRDGVQLRRQRPGGFAPLWSMEARPAC
ncbi:SDH family Clp fold serine proteinase [Janthinobacterium sp. RT4P48]|uniref:SDH family Clp fold serine proteinase n=1 Tax=Janthinobacterium sp. RT4P48 TaxID=3424188 RepID=UPI003F22E9E7